MVLALSGKCCSGKNYIAQIMENYGFISIDVDLVARDVFNESRIAILEIFGETVLVNDQVDRGKVGDILFAEKSKREALESLIHPLTYKKIYELLDSNPSGDYIINIPILKEKELIERCSAIVWIRSPLLLRVFRALKRDNYKFPTVIRRIIAQKKLSVKYLQTTVDKYYIDNSWFSNTKEASKRLIWQIKQQKI